MSVDLELVETVSGGGRLLTAGELAERWQVTSAHVYRLAREGFLPCVNLGPRRVRFRVDRVEEFERNGGCTDA